MKKMPKVITLLYKCARAAKDALQRAKAEVEKSKGYVLYNEFNPAEVYHTPDLIGHAWIEIKKCNRFPQSAFVKWFKRLARSRGKVERNYFHLTLNEVKFTLTKRNYGDGGYLLWVEVLPSNSMFITPREAVHRAAANVLREYGMEAVMMSRLD